MPRRRMITDELIYDKRFNDLSIEAQTLFLRMLTKADDCGVIPADEYALVTMINAPARVRRNFKEYLDEIVSGGLGIVFDFEGKPFFAFNRHSFDRIQSYILNKRTKSEYLNIPTEEALSVISGKFLETSGNSTPALVESRKKRVESSKKKDVREVVIPESLSSLPNFSDVWGRFLQYCNERGKKLTPTGIESLFKKLESFPDPIQSLENTIGNNWQGVFDSSRDKFGRPKERHTITAEELARSIIVPESPRS